MPSHRKTRKMTTNSAFIAHRSPAHPFRSASNWLIHAALYLGASVAPILFSGPPARVLAAEPIQADVIVYGATPAGFCAAIGAAREGASVLLLEPTAHVGGVNTGGLCFSDSNQTVRAALGGLFEEWHLRIEQDYQSRGVKLPYEVQIKDHAHWTYEPHVAARVTEQLLKEAGVKLVTEQPLTRIESESGRIIRINSTTGSVYTAQVYVDATYEGDLMAAAGVSWTIGREGRAEHGEPYAGKQFPKPKLPISGLDAHGEPLPLITAKSPGPDEAGDTHVMTYSFRLCLTDQPDNRIPFPKPTNYDPARFEVVRRYFQTERNPPIPWDLYPLPGGKFDANNGIGKQFSMGLIGAGDSWCAATPSEREKLFEEYRQYTLEFHHFLTTDPSVPEEIRTKMASLGLCRDEFPQTQHWSPQLYVREGRRMRGAYTLTEHDVLTQIEKPDSIGISSFPIDSHDCQRIAFPEGGVINEGTIFPVRMSGRRHGFPSQVPYRALLPKPEECTNLLVPVALSATHVAFSSIRVEPTWMTLGQSAGIAAALAAREKMAVQELPYPLLRERLLAQHQILDLPELPPLPPPEEFPVSVEPKTFPGIILDDADATLEGQWERSRNFQPHIGAGYRHDGQSGSGNSAARWTFSAPQTGRYEVRMAYSAHPTRSTRVPITIQSGESSRELIVDQTLPLPTKELFRTIGAVELKAEVPSTITVRNNDANGFVILDAIQLLPLPKTAD